MGNNGGAESYPFTSQKRALEEAGLKKAAIFPTPSTKQIQLTRLTLGFFFCF